MLPAKTKVIYIAGETRSGSTLLSNILGEIDGFFNVGELVEIWDKGQTWPCSCGLAVRECAIWRDVFQRTPVLNDPHAIDQLIALRDEYAHTKQVPFALWSRRGERKLQRVLAPFLDALADLYRAIQVATNSTVIVDASKNIGYGYMLGMVPSIDLHVVHLIRDARATVHSWHKKKEGLWTQKPTHTALRWAFRNAVTEMYGAKRLPSKYLRLNYETFVKQPAECLANILSLAGSSGDNLPLSGEREVTLSCSHGICGNPDRFQRGAIRLRVNNGWTQMDRKLLMFLTLLTCPLLRRYRYPLFPASDQVHESNRPSKSLSQT